MEFFLVMLITLEHIVCSILKLTKSWRLAKSPSTRPFRVALLSLSVQVMMSWDSLSLRKSSLMKKMMRRIMHRVEIVYLLLPLLPRRSTTALLLHLRLVALQTEFKWKLMLRGRQSRGEKLPGWYRGIIHLRRSSGTWMNALHSRFRSFCFCCVF